VITLEIPNGVHRVNGAHNDFLEVDVVLYSNTMGIYGPVPYQMSDDDFVALERFLDKAFGRGLWAISLVDVSSDPYEYWIDGHVHYQPSNWWIMTYTIKRAPW
jgi:hypothetical protein